MGDGSDLVYLTTASGQVEAGAMRAFLEANEVFCYVQGEQHNAVLGPAGSFIIDLRVLVADRDLDRARELVQAFRAAEPLEDGEELDSGEADSEPAVERPAARAVSPGKAALAALLPGFGFGHILTGALGRGAAILALEILGVSWVLGGDVVRGGVVVAGAVAVDLIGSVRRARAAAGTPLPAARVAGWGERGGVSGRPGRRDRAGRTPPPPARGESRPSG